MPLSMSPSTFKRLKSIVQISAATLSFTINLLLIYLIVTKSSKSMANYRHLMVFFCCSCLVFSVMDITVQPILHSYKSSFIMIMEVEGSKIPVSVGKVLLAGMAGCFGITIYGIAVHFVYRYFAVERQGRTKYFDNKYLLLWLLVPVLGGIAWFLVSYSCSDMTRVNAEYIRETIKTSFDLEMSNIIYLAGVFWPLDEHGTPFFCYQTGFVAMSFLALSSIPLTIILTCFCKSVGKIKEFPESDYSKNLQLQLYNALVAQTCIPLVCLFIPFGILFTFPFFEINVAPLADSLTFTYVLYPVVDPLPILFFVENYRNSILGAFHCKGANAVHAMSEDIPEN